MLMKLVAQQQQSKNNKHDNSKSYCTRNQNIKVYVQQHHVLQATAHLTIKCIYSNTMSYRLQYTRTLSVYTATPCPTGYSTPEHKVYIQQHHVQATAHHNTKCIRSNTMYRLQHTITLSLYTATPCPTGYSTP